MKLFSFTQLKLKNSTYRGVNEIIHNTSNIFDICRLSGCGVFTIYPTEDIDSRFGTNYRLLHSNLHAFT